MKKRCIIFILIAIFATSIVSVSASGGFVPQSNLTELFNEGSINTKHIGEDSVYPFSSVDSTKIKSVGFDIIYGVTRDLLYYTGEIPYADTYFDNTPETGFEELPYNYHAKNIGMLTGASGLTPSGKDYWGDIDLSSADEISLELLEGVNDNGVVSLRLHALSNAKHRGLLFFGGSIIYKVFLYLAYFGSLLCGLVIRVKNINVLEIFEAMNLEDVNKLVVELFVSKDGHLAPLALFCLIAFLISMVGFVLSYVKGTKKEKNLFSDIILVAIVGLAIVVMAVLGKGLDIGSSLANFTNNVLATTIESTEDGSKLWVTSTKHDKDDTSSASSDLMYTELSTINKSLIDMQICVQFGVKDIDELKLTNLLGRTLSEEDYQPLKNIYSAKRKTYEFKLPSAIIKNGLDDNLGYYYWFANSPYESVLIGNTSVPAYSYNQHDKLTSMFTFLQAQYNKSDATVKSKIVNIVDSFTQPSAWANSLNMLMLICVYLCLAYVLFAYGYKVVLAKMTMVFGIIAMPISGLLIITTKDSLVKTGKGLFGLLAISVIKVVIYSLVFDLLIYLATSLLAVNLLRMLITAIMLVLLAIANPYIAEAIDKSVNRIEATIAPDARAIKATAKDFARRSINNIQDKRNSESHGKVVGYDEAGNPIRQSKRGDTIDTLLSGTKDRLSGTAASRRSLGKLFRDQDKIRADSKQKADDRVKKSAQNQRTDESAKAMKDVDTITAEIDEVANNAYNDIVDEANNSYDLDALTEEENDTHDELRSTESDLENLRSANKELIKKELRNEELSETEKEDLKAFKAKATELDGRTASLKSKLNSSIKQRMQKDAQDAYKDELNDALDTAIDKNNDVMTSSNHNERAFIANQRLTRMKEELASDEVVNAQTTHQDTRDGKQQYQQYVRENNLDGNGKIGARKAAIAKEQAEDKSYTIAKNKERERSDTKKQQAKSSAQQTSTATTASPATKQQVSAAPVVVQAAKQQVEPQLSVKEATSQQAAKQQTQDTAEVSQVTEQRVPTTAVQQTAKQRNSQTEQHVQQKPEKPAVLRLTQQKQPIEPVETAQQNQKQKVVERTVEPAIVQQTQTNDRKPVAKTVEPVETVAQRDRQADVQPPQEVETRTEPNNAETPIKPKKDEAHVEPIVSTHSTRPVKQETKQQTVDDFLRDLDVIDFDAEPKDTFTLNGEEVKIESSAVDGVSFDENGIPKVEFDL